MVLSDEARAYKSLVCATHRRRELRGNISVAIDWHRGRKSGDLDKRIGVVLDALQGVAYENDSQIVELSALRFESPNNPRVVVRVAPAVPFTHSHT